MYYYFVALLCEWRENAVAGGQTDRHIDTLTERVYTITLSYIALVVVLCYTTCFCIYPGKYHMQMLDALLMMYIDIPERMNYGVSL